MKRLLCCLLIAVFLLMPISANAIEETSAAISTELQNGLDEYIYPITSESADWQNYTVSEKVEMLEIPQETLSQMTDKRLLDAVASYPYLVDIYLYGNSVSDGIAVARTYFCALDELLSRESAADTLTSFVAQSQTALASAISQGEMPTYSFEQRALTDIFLYCNDNQIASVATTAVVEDYVQTPRNSDVIVLFTSEEHTAQFHALADSEVIATYSVTIVKPGSCEYNCHYFAWHLKGSIVRIDYAWMNDPNLYMRDGSYDRIYSGNLNTAHYLTSIRSGTIIFYGDINGDITTWHSAFCNDTSVAGDPLAAVQCMSKWGTLGVFQHAMGNVPSGYDKSIITAWE